MAINLNKKISIKTTDQIFRLRNFLQQISHISFTFSNLNQEHPIASLGEKDGKDIIIAYENLLKDTQNIIKRYKEALLRMDKDIS